MLCLLLQSLLCDENLSKVPFLVLGNKIDMAPAASEDELRYALGLFDTFGKDSKPDNPGVRPIELYMCSVVKRMGYADGKLSISTCVFMTVSLQQCSIVLLARSDGKISDKSRTRQGAAWRA